MPLRSWTASCGSRARRARLRGSISERGAGWRTWASASGRARSWPGRGRLWIVDASPFSKAGSLVRVEPRRVQVTGRRALGHAPVAVAVSQGAVWVADELDDEVVRIDPRTLRIVARIPVGAAPTAVRGGRGAIWVANSGERTVSRIDPRSNRVTTIHVGLAPRALAVG